MAADLKYAGLSGIAVDQPDMYDNVEGGEREEQEDSSSSAKEGETMRLTSLSCSSMCNMSRGVWLPSHTC